MAASAITTREELRGARVGVRALGAGQWIQTVLALEYLGLDCRRDQIRTLPIGDEAQITFALGAGEIDAAVVSPAQAHLLKARKFSDLLDLYAANIYGYPDALAIRTTHLERFPDVAERVVAALIEAMAFSLAPGNEPTVVCALMNVLGITDAAAAGASYQEFLLTAMRKPYPCLERLLQMQRIMAQHERNVLSVVVADLIDDHVVRNLDASGAIDRLYVSAAPERPR
jgi:hypothetical protein